MKTLKPLVLLLLVFIAGIVVGVIGTRVVVQQVIRSVVANPDLIWRRIERVLAAHEGFRPVVRRTWDALFSGKLGCPRRSDSMQEGCGVLAEAYEYLLARGGT